MSRWVGVVDLQRDPDGSGRYSLGRNLTYIGRTHEIRVFCGFWTDGASVPRFMWWWTDPYSGPWVAPAIIHDGLYAAQVTSRKKADSVLYEAMLDCGVRRTQAALIWAAVRLFGGLAWRRNSGNRSSMRNYVSCLEVTR